MEEATVQCLPVKVKQNNFVSLRVDISRRLDRKEASTQAPLGTKTKTKSSGIAVVFLNFGSRHQI